jgi:hypothetical protein
MVPVIRSLVLLVLVSLSICWAQTPEPEFSDVFARLDQGKLIDLERQPITIKGKASGFIVMNIKTTARLPEGKSPVRFKAGETLDFIVRSALAMGSVDPSMFYCLRKLDAKKDHRELTITGGRVTPLGASISTNYQEGTLPIIFKKYGTTSYEVSTAGLEPGEYAIGNIHPQVLFLFGVDGPHK